MRQDPAAEEAMWVIESVKQAVLTGAPITPGVEGQVQDALWRLREGADREAVRRAERVSALVFGVLQSRLNGRTNLQDSQLLRLRRA